jgi:hypothetical protein
MKRLWVKLLWELRWVPNRVYWWLVSKKAVDPYRVGPPFC